MNTREIAAEYRMAHWAGIMRERQESGLSIKAFCEASGFHENVYFYWQRKLRAAARQTMLPMERELPGAGTPAGWAAVCKSTKPERENDSIYIEIGKSRIKALPNIDLEHLSKVCRVLMALC